MGWRDRTDTYAILIADDEFQYWPDQMRNPDSTCVSSRTVFSWLGGDSKTDSGQIQKASH